MSSHSKAETPQLFSSNILSSITKIKWGRKPTSWAALTSADNGAGLTYADIHKIPNVRKPNLVFSAAISKPQDFATV